MDLENKYNLLIDGIKKLFKLVDHEIIADDVDSPANHELFTEAQLIPLCIKEKLEEVKKTFQTKILNIIRTRISTTDSTTSLNASEAQELFNELTDSQVEKIKSVFGIIDINIDNKLKKLIGSGNITTMSCSDILQVSGWSILAERINYWRFLSHFESVSRGAFFATLKTTTVRKLRPESWGFLCPVHTPDGAPCGLLIHLTKSCFVTNKAFQLDTSVIFSMGLIPVNLNNLCIEISYEKGPKIFEAIYINDNISSMMRKVLNIKSNTEEWIGIREQTFLNIRLAEYKTKDIFNFYDFESALQLDSIKPKVDLQDNNLIGAGDIINEFRYKEIDNLNVFSTVASCIALADYNQSPRNIYQCQMAKQAMGIPALNLNYRTDNKSYFINYLQTPMVKTSYYDIFKNYPIGFNCIVAVLSYTAYDMEDAVIINKSANERGLFNAYVYKTEKFVLEKNSFIEYTPFVGETVNPDDIIVKYTNDDYGPGAMKYHGTEVAVVDAVRVFDNETPCITITFRINRNPNIGDKFCSRHGQKGVCSMLWPEIDMPFTEQGLRPDIIINPHAFPSRMTIGMLLESMCGKAALAAAEFKDGTPFKKEVLFEEDNEKCIGEELRKYGFNYYGNEPMYSGITGTEFRTDIFIGSVYYQRLRHMVNDKFQVRTSGAVVATTRQPVGGRKNKGGIRFGEMERDALIAHGSSYLLKDRLLDCSDKSEFAFCEDCQSILFTDKNVCACGGVKIKMIELPYVFKYLCVEFLAMNIRVKLEVE